MRPRYNLSRYFFKFVEALFLHVEAEGRRLASKWRAVPSDRLEDQIYQEFEQYWVEFSREQMPIPWLKIAALAMVGWLRNNYPEQAEQEFRHDVHSD